MAVTEMTVYSEAVFINRTGLPLRVRSVRKGTYVQRCSYGLHEINGEYNLPNEARTLSVLTNSRIPLSPDGESGRNLCQNLCQNLIDKNPTDQANNSNIQKIGSKTGMKIGMKIEKKKSFQLDDFTVQSRRTYTIIESVQVGDLLYTDRPQLKWSFLPPILK